jgi:hypothetical protein
MLIPYMQFHDFLEPQVGFGQPETSKVFKTSLSRVAMWLSVTIYGIA